MDENSSIEVTDEMAQAGISALVSCISDAPRILPDNEIVTVIFSAMRDAELHQCAATKEGQFPQQFPL
jgi:hypothetical protein